MDSGGRKYKLLRELGTGTFGTVYQAEMSGQGGFKKTVALKVLHPVWEADQDAARRFRDEARLLGQIRHRHIVQVDGLVKVGGRWAVVMEYVPGCDGNVVLKACRRAGEPFPVPAALEVVSAVASALDAAYNAHGEHEQPLRVVHRDIKPSNIRLTEDGDVKVLDFGIARADFEGREAMTHSVRYGSVRYMAPESHAKGGKDSPAGDVFALGCVLYEFLTGRPLGTVEAEWAQHQQKMHDKVEKLREGLGPEGNAIADLIGRMLAFEIDRRPTAAEVAEKARTAARAYPGEDLGTFAKRFFPDVGRHVPDTSMPIDRTVTEGGSDQSGKVGSSGTAKPPPSGPRPASGAWLVVVALAAVLLVMLLVVVGALFLGGEDGDAALAQVGAPVVPVVPVLPVPPRVTPPAPLPVAPLPPESPPTESPPTESPPIASPPTESLPVEPSAVTPPKVPPLPPVVPPIKPIKPPPTVPPVTTVAAVTGDARPLRGAKFTMIGATAISASCKGSKASGTTSVLVRDLWPGPCSIAATLDGNTYLGTVDIASEQGLTCVVEGDHLSCR